MTPRQYTLEQKARRAEQYRAWADKNKEYRRAYWRRVYYAKKKDNPAELARRRAYYQANKGRHREWKKQHRRKHLHEFKLMDALGVTFRQAHAMLAYGPPKPFKLEQHPQLIERAT